MKAHVYFSVRKCDVSDPAVLPFTANARRFRLGAGTSPWEISLEFHNILGLVPLRPFCHVEFHVIAFVQRLETTGLDSGMVHENIIPGIAPDKSVAFFIVKPLNYALFFHFSSSLLITSNPARSAETLILSVFVPFETHGGSKPNGGDVSTSRLYGPFSFQAYTLIEVAHEYTRNFFKKQSLQKFSGDSRGSRPSAKKNRFPPGVSISFLPALRFRNRMTALFSRPIWIYR